MSQATTNYIETRQFGTARINLITDGTMTWTPTFPISAEERQAAMPEAGPNGELTLEINIGLVQIGDATILIDPGCDDPDSEWQRQFAVEFPPVVRTPGFAAGLERLGVPPDSVDALVITHPHLDHIAGLTVERDGVLVPRFPNARHYLGRADWEDNPVRSNPESIVSTRLGPVADHGLLDLVDADLEIAPGVSILAAPGETPGHQVVRVRSDGETFYYLGDLFHHLCEITNLDWVPHGNARQVRESRERLLAEIIQSDAVVATSHERFPPWRKIVREGDGYSWTPI